MESERDDAAPFPPDQDAALPASPAVPSTTRKKNSANLKASSWYERARQSIGTRSERD
jgi:hypothetical protein